MMSFHTFATFCLLLTVEASSVYIRDTGVPHRRMVDSDIFVAFSVGLTHNQPLAKNDTVVYDKVWTNKGNGYDSSTGIFTCSVPGVYTFIFHGLSETTGAMSLDIYKNNDYQMSAFAHETADYAAATNSVTLSLNDGDQVYIRGHGTSLLYGRTDEIYATFTGFLLIPTEQV